MSGLFGGFTFGRKYVIGAIADTVAPTLTNPIAAANSGTTAAASITTSEDNGTIYWYVSTSTTAPNISDLKVGRGAAASSSVLVTTSGVQNFAITGLTSVTVYYAYFLHVDAAGNASDIAATLSFATQAPIDVTPPTLSSPTSSASGQNGGTLGVTTNEGNGTLYWYVGTSATPPSAANLKGGAGATVSGASAVTAVGAQSVSVIGLTASTTYYGFLLHRDAAGNDSAIATTASFTTAAAVGSYPASVTNATWSATAKTVYDLSSTANTGYRTAPTKVIGVDALPANVSFVNGVLTLGAGGGTFSGWTSGDNQIDVTGDGWTIEDNFFNGDGAGNIYALRSVGNTNIIRYNTFDGNYGQNIHTELFMSGSGSQAYRNRFLGCQSDSIKVPATTTADATRPQFYENYLTIGGWASASGVHFDCITHSLGGALYQHNLFDMTPYTDPANRTFNALDATTPVNPPPVGAPAGRFTWGLTSYIRFQDDTAGGTMDNVTVNQNIFRGFKRGGFYGFSIVNDQIEGAFTFTDNIIEEGVHNGLFHPNLPTDDTFFLTFTGNRRYSDGASFNDYTTGSTSTGYLGATSVAPSPPVIASIDSITDTSFRLIYDRGGDTGANGNHKYALSTNGGTTWGPWISSSGTVSGLTPASSYMVKMQATNSHGTSAPSNILSVTTTGAAVADTTPPTITSANPSGSYAEMVPISGSLAANETVRWAVTGTDAAAVTLDPSTGAWSLETTDFETKTSYSFSFVATDTAGNVGTPQAVAITITDVVEGGSGATPTSYSFSTDRADLALEPGWALQYGDTGALFPSGGVLHRGAVTNSEHFYREGAFVTGTQKAGITFGSTGSLSPRLVVLGSGAAGTFTGYQLQAVNGTSLRVYRHISGASTTIISTVSVATSLAAFSLEVVVNGSNDNTVNVYDAGGALLATYHDTTAGCPATGYNGLRSLTNTSSATSNGDNFLGNMQA